MEFLKSQSGRWGLQPFATIQVSQQQTLESRDRPNCRESVFTYQSISKGGAVGHIVTAIRVQEDGLTDTRTTSPARDFQFADCFLNDRQWIAAVTSPNVQVYGDTQLVCETLEQRGVADFRLTLAGYENTTTL